MRNFADKLCEVNKKTHILCSMIFSPENHAVYEIIWKNIAQPDRPQMTL
jgi:hypothetical protein